MFVCVCNAITEKQILAGIADGDATPEDIYVRYHCTAQCYSCVDEIAEMIAVTPRP
jgi:bacterioferritin-associated ferredoxin